jgi:hypothetical protein
VDDIKQEEKLSDKELNFRLQAASYEKKLAEKENALKEYERRLEELSRTQNDKEDDYEPYVDEKKLNKKLTQFGQQTQQQTQQEIRKMLKEERDQMWVQSHSDFDEIMKGENLQKFANKDPELAKTILEMPDTFERKKLVYNNIKALGLHKPEEPKENIQDLINNNPRKLYYQPSNVGQGPYNSSGDFSQKGQKEAYEKMQELKSRLRLG